MHRSPDGASRARRIAHGPPKNDQSVAGGRHDHAGGDEPWGCSLWENKPIVSRCEGGAPPDALRDVAGALQQPESPVGRGSLALIRLNHCGQQEHQPRRSGSLPIGPVPAEASAADNAASRVRQSVDEAGQDSRLGDRTSKQPGWPPFLLGQGGLKVAGFAGGEIGSTPAPRPRSKTSSRVAAHWLSTI